MYRTVLLYWITLSLSTNLCGAFESCKFWVFCAACVQVWWFLHLWIWCNSSMRACCSGSAMLWGHGLLSSHYPSLIVFFSNMSRESPFSISLYYLYTLFLLLLYFLYISMYSVHLHVLRWGQCVGQAAISCMCLWQGHLSNLCSLSITPCSLGLLKMDSSCLWLLSTVMCRPQTNWWNRLLPNRIIFRSVQ